MFRNRWDSYHAELYFSMSLLRISTLRTFPLMVFGMVSTNSTTRGYLYGAVSLFVKFWISFFSSSVGSKPDLRMI